MKVFNVQQFSWNASNIHPPQEWRGRARRTELHRSGVKDLNNMLLLVLPIWGERNRQGGSGVATLSFLWKLCQGEGHINNSRYYPAKKRTARRRRRPRAARGEKAPVTCKTHELLVKAAFKQPRPPEALSAEAFAVRTGVCGESHVARNNGRRLEDSELAVTKFSVRSSHFTNKTERKPWNDQVFRAGSNANPGNCFRARAPERWWW